MRYTRLYLYFLRFSVSSALLFRFDFFFRIIMDCVYYAVNIAFYIVVFDHTTILAGWSKEQAMIFVAGYLWADAFNMTVFANNFWYFPQYINKGELDYYLIRPVSALFFLSFREIAVNSFVNLLIASGILLYFFFSYFTPGLESVFQFILYVIFLLIGLWLFVLLRLLTILPVFWMHAVRGLDTMFWSMQKLAERPDGIYTGIVRLFLLTLIPFGLMFSFPARLILNGFEWKILFHMLIACFIFSGLVAIVWKEGLKSYSSASS